MKYRGLLLPMILAAMCGTPGFTIVGITRTFQLGNALPRSQDRAFPNWRVWVIPVAEMQGFHTFVSKNPIRFSDGSVSNHHVPDKFGWAWRDPKYKSETELCAMLKWAKEKGLTIEELSI